MKMKDQKTIIGSSSKLRINITIFFILSVLTLSAQAQILPDQYEPDNNIPNAKPIAFNVPQTRTIHFISSSENDKDVISIFLPEPGDITLTIQGEIVFGRLRISDSLPLRFGYGLSGQGVNGQTYISGVSTFSVGRVLRAGLYYIELNGIRSRFVDQGISKYTITATYSPGTIANHDFLARDRYEPNDSIFTAGPAIANEIQERTFHAPEDVDWIAFRLDGCVNILVENAGIPSPGGQIAMRLWNQKFEVIENTITEENFNNEVVQASFLRELKSGIYYISLTQIGVSSISFPDPYVFRISGFLCEPNFSYLPPIINHLLND